MVFDLFPRFDPGLSSLLGSHGGFRLAWTDVSAGTARDGITLMGIRALLSAIRRRAAGLWNRAAGTSDAPAAEPAAQPAIGPAEPAAPAAPAPELVFTELRAPTQCALWEKPELVNLADRFDTVEELIDKSHLSRSVLRCRECGQLYFYEFYEIVDWEDGNDRMYWTFIPVDAPEQIAALKEASVFDLMRYTPRLLRDMSGSKGTRWIR
jgi:hypothetical protein